MDSRLAPLVCELPDRVLRHVAALLDAPALHNWRSLVALVPGYSQRDIMAFIIEEQNVSLQSLSTSRALYPSLLLFSSILPPQGRSASMELLRDLHARCWTVVDLALLARRAQLAIVTDTIREYYAGE